MSIHIISNTHWDREWRFSFEETRLKLVDMMDKLLEIFEKDSDFKFYHLDSQTNPIEDYLEMRPENRKRIEELLKSGKLLAGPWYVLPDEYMVTGESLARNLLIGHSIAEKFGKVMKVGYNPFSFCGQITQIAQIYNNFDIDTIIFYRGIGDEGNGKDFYLDSPDGSRLLNIRLTDWGRCNFLYFMFRGLICGKEPEDVNTYSTEEKGRCARMCFNDFESRDLSMLRPPFSFHSELLEKQFNDFYERVKAPSSTEQYIGMDGYDSSSPSEFTSRIINEVAENFKVDIKHSSFPILAEAVKKEIKEKNIQLPAVEKEMRHIHNTFIGALSSRYYIKQQNRNAEFSLQKTAEPFAVLAWLQGKKYPQTELLHAWKSLLVNQSHDSIGGCSADKVHRDMEQRFRKTEEIAKGLTRRNLYYLGSKFDTENFNDKEIALTVFNPSVFQRNEIIKADLMIPDNWNFKFPSVETLKGEKIECEISPGDKWTANAEKTGMDVHSFINAKLWKITFAADKIPAMGWKTFKVLSDTKRKSEKNQPADNPTPEIMENKFLKAEIKSNGTINLLNKKTGRKLKNLHWFEDRGECGGAWNSAAPDNDKVLNTKKCKAEIKIHEDNRFVCSREIKISFPLPVDVSSDEKTRKKETRNLKIKTIASLEKKSDELHFETEVDNNVKSHRLRVMLPSGVKSAKFADAEGQFDVVKRKIRTPNPEEYGFGRHDFNPWNKQVPLTSHPQLSFLDVNDGKNGMGVLNFAMCEYEVCDDEERTVALTLLRTFPKLLVLETLLKAEEAQCIGKGTFKYAVVPHQGNWEKAELHKRAEIMNIPILPMQFYPDGEKGPLPLEYSGLKIDGAVLDAVKKAEKNNSIIIRFHNPSEENKNVSITLPEKSSKVYECNINEERKTDIDLKRGKLNIDVSAKKIVTLEACLD